MCESVGKANLLSDHFDGTQSKESFDLPLTCHPPSSLTSFALRSSEVRRLLLDLDPYGGSDPLGVFPPFLKRIADVLAHRLGVVFRRLVRLGSFMACRRQAYVTPLPKGPPSSSVANYQPISITSVLSKMFERLVSVRLERFMERSGVRVAYTAKCIGQWAGGWIEKIDFSAAFYRVNDQGILYKLCSMGIGGSVLSILTQFLSNRSQYAMVDGCRSKLVNVVPGVP